MTVDGESGELTLSELLRRWVEVFSKRPDIRVRKKKAAAPCSAQTLTGLEGQLPPDVLAFARETGAFDFTWSFVDGDEEEHGFHLVDVSKLHRYRTPGAVHMDAHLDRVTHEANTVLSYDEGETPARARLVFDNANDGTRREMGSLAEYLQAGAKQGFVWFWQRVDPGPKSALRRLYEGSLRSDTPEEEVVSALQGCGLGEREARALWGWLGESTVLLVPRTAARPRAEVGTLETAFKMKGGKTSTSPVIVGDRAYWGTDQTVHALDLTKKRKKVWSTVLPHPLRGLVVVEDAALAAIAPSDASENGQLVWLDAKNGEVVRTVSVSDPQSIAVAGGAVFVLLAKRVLRGRKWEERAPFGEVRVFDLASGEERPPVRLEEGHFFGSMLPAGDSLVLSESEAAMSTNAPERSIRVVTGSSVVRLDGLEAHAAGPGRILASRWGDRALQLLDVEGRVSWEQADVRPVSPRFGAAIDDAHVVTFDPRTWQVQLLDAKTGERSWVTEAVPGAKEVETQPLLHEGRVFALLEGKLTALALADGRIEATAKDATAAGLAQGAALAPGRVALVHRGPSAHTLFVMSVG